MTAEEVVRAEIAARSSNDVVTSHFVRDASPDLGPSTKSRLAVGGDVVTMYRWPVMFAHPLSSEKPRQALTDTFVLPTQFNSPAAPMEF